MNALLIRLNELSEWDTLNISKAITIPAKELNLNLGEVYSLLYIIFLGEKSGPKLARLLQELDKNSVCNLISQAATHKTL